MHRAPVTAPISRLSHRLPSMIIYFLISALSHFINNYSSFYCWPKFPLLFPLIDSVYLPLSIWSHPLGPIHLPLSIFLQSICLWSACDMPVICLRSATIYLDLSRSIYPIYRDLLLLMNGFQWPAFRRNADVYLMILMSLMNSQWLNSKSKKNLLPFDPLVLRLTVLSCGPMLCGSMLQFNTSVLWFSSMPQLYQFYAFRASVPLLRDRLLWLPY